MIGVNNTHQNATINFGIFYTCMGIFGFILTTFGLSANSILIYIFTTDKYFRKTHYILMLVSVISDTISNTTAFFSSAFLLRINSDYLSAFISCKIITYVIFTSYAISIFNLILIALDRYMSLVKPMNMLYRNHKNRLLIVYEMAILIISTSTTIPFLFFSGTSKQDTKLCDFPDITLKVSIYLVFSAILYFILPSITTAILYWQIIINRRHYIRPGQSSIFRDSLRKQRLIKILIKISLVYILSTCPCCIVLIALAITQKSLLQIRNQSFALYILTLLCMSATTSISVFNSLLYLKFDGNIAAKFKKIFGTRRFFGDINTVSITVSSHSRKSSQ